MKRMDEESKGEIVKFIAGAVFLIIFAILGCGLSEIAAHFGGG